MQSFLSRMDRTLDPGSGWTIHQDNILIGAYITDSLNFEELKRRLPGKTQEQCRQRWAFYKDQTGNKGTWTRHEDQILQVCQKEYGNRWKSIKTYLPGRSENAVKNRWTALVKKATPGPDSAEARGLSPPDARRKMQAHQSQLRRLQTQPPSSADMHLRLSPGAFGMHSDSPGPTADTAWGNTSGINNSFSFYSTSSLQETPSKARLSPPGGIQPPQALGSRHNTPGRHYPNNTPLALKVDTNSSFGYAGGFGSASRSRLDESTASMSPEDMSELAEAFVQQEVEKFRKQHGATMSAEDQMLIRKAFVAGMQHTPGDKDASGADLQWEFDQSGSIDAMISMEEDQSQFDGVVQGHAIFHGAKSPDKFSRSGLMNSSNGMRPLGPADLSVEGHSWGGPLHSDLLTTENLDEMSMSLLNMSIEDSQDQGQGQGQHPGFQ